MSEVKRNFPKPISLILILLLMLSFSTSVLTSCSSSDAAEKKAKSKKNKAEKNSEQEESEHEEEKAESEHSDKKTEKEEAHKADDKHADKAKDEHSKKEAVPSGEETWTALMSGNKRFVAGKHTLPQFASMRKSLVEGQHPKAIILGCADSRVPPELLFDKNLGEIFVVRDAGNITDEVSLGSIEYAFEHLHANLLVILGHESCGAVAAAVSGEKMPTKNLQAIVDTIAPSFEGSKTCPLGGKSNMDCVKLNVGHSSDDVVSKSPILKKAVAEKELTIVRAIYKLDTGEVSRLD